MGKKRLSVVVTRRLPDAVETRLSELFDVTLREDDTPMSRSELAEAIQGADVLVPTVTDEIDGALIGQAGDRLKLIANYGAGVDHIDVATARQVMNSADTALEFGDGCSLSEFMSAQPGDTAAVRLKR